ncbi:MAG: biotin--[acetyl-CoA-carboxylase] ligase [Chloroflexi bacterium]|nr:biotin--[acetyl-CoA-carboxylase] ligase [Chloroflexota bacterium]
MDESSLRGALDGLPVPALQYFDTTGSTNTVALDWLSSGAPDGALVMADTQTAGRGRMDRRWITHPGAGLAFSLCLKPSPAEQGFLNLYSPLGAVALSSALEEQYGLVSEIKWPNDVLLQRQKVCGILVEAAWLGSQLQGVVLGMGINVTPESVPQTEDLLYPATSVESILNRPVDRTALLRAVVEKIFTWRPWLGKTEFFTYWESRLAFCGEWVRIEQAGQGAIFGQVRGIGPNGDLILELPGGQEQRITVGDVHLRQA